MNKSLDTSARDSAIDFDPHCESIISRFEQALLAGKPFDLKREVDGVAVGQRAGLLTELACIELEITFQRDTSGATTELQRSKLVGEFEQVFEVPRHRAEIAREHYRLCRVHGCHVPRAEIAALYEVEFSEGDELPVKDVDESSAVPFPSVGSVFCNFPLVAELGRGSLGRVFLARQPDLDKRLVVLKLTRRLTTEASKLVKLRHKGIIPVYSIHESHGLYAICMPYLGALTLGHLVRDGRIFARVRTQEQDLISTLVQERSSTIVASTTSAGTFAAAPAQTAAVVDNKVPSENARNCRSHASPDFEAAYHGDDFELSLQELGLQELTESLRASYVERSTAEAKIFLVLQVARAVAHAHQHGIVHRDLKPENILIANDGHPVLLDFNLSACSDRDERQLVGGTLPYMSPQQFASLHGAGVCLPADDVYSLGVILYELLTGHRPGLSGNQIDALTSPAAAVTTTNEEKELKGFPPSLLAIVNKCLADQRELRYPTATELSEDLERFLANRVLRYARDVSPVERTKKLIRRHPILTSGTTLLVAFVALLVVGGVSIIAARQRRLQMVVGQRFDRLMTAYPETISLLTSPGHEPELVEQGLHLADQLIAEWGISSDLTRQNGVIGVEHALLTAQARQAVEQKLANLLVAMSAAEFVVDPRSSDSLRPLVTADEPQTIAMQPADRWLALAERLFPEEVSTARRRFAAKTRLGQIVTTAAASDWLQFAEQETRLHPTDPSCWFTLGSARFVSGDLDGARNAYDVAAKLQPESAVAVFWRGVMQLRLGDYTQAKTDFDFCIERAPEWSAARFNRALALRGERNGQLAISDLNWIVDHSHGSPRVFNLRAKIQFELGNQAAARADQRAALEVEPATAEDWIVQGVLRMVADPQLASQCFKNALDLEPNNATAWQNLAHVQSEHLQQLPEAVESMSKLVALQPIASAYASRGILLARSGLRDAALGDARTAAMLQPEPVEMLQIAGIYSLIRTDDSHVQLGLQWLAMSLAADPKLRDVAAMDPDLESLRKVSACQLLLETSAINR